MIFYNNRDTKVKMRTYEDIVYTNFCGLHVPEDDRECESFTENVNLLTLYLLTKTNITFKYN